MGNSLRFAEKTIVVGHRIRRGLSYSGVCVFVALLLLVGGRWWWRRPTVVESALYVSPKDLQVGPVLAQTDYTHSLVVANISNRPVKIDRFLTSCECVDVAPESLLLDVGQSAAITLKLDLLRYLTLSEEALVPCKINITPVVGSASDRTRVLHIDLIRPEVYTLSREMDFGLVSPAADEVQSANVLYVSPTAADIHATTSFPLFAGLRLVPSQKTDSGYSLCHLVANLSHQSRPCGEFTFSVEVARDRTDEPVILPSRVTFDSVLQARIDSFPPRIIAVGQPVSWTVVVRAVSTPPDSVELRLAERNDDCALEIEREQLDDSAWRFFCSCRPNAAGNQRLLMVASGLLDGSYITTQPMEMRFYALADAFNPKPQ